VCLLHEPPPAIVVANAIGGEHFDGDLTVKPRIARAIHLAHPAGTDEREYLVRPECRAGLEGHRFRAIIGARARTEMQRIGGCTGSPAEYSPSRLTLHGARVLVVSYTDELGMP
jgi:hypothetical protein